MLTRIALVIAFAFLTTSTAWAGSHYESALSSCSTINCAGMTIRGIQQANEPFVIQVFAREGECMRLDVSTQTEDTAMVIIATTAGDFASVDDTFELRPIFGLDPVPATGWYTVAVGYFTYDPRIARFTLEYGRYPTGSINCSQATANQAMAPAQLKSLGVSGFKEKSPATDVSDAAGQVN
jgi:hypothetical protein